MADARMVPPPPSPPRGPVNSMVALQPGGFALTNPGRPGECHRLCSFDWAIIVRVTRSAGSKQPEVRRRVDVGYGQLVRWEVPLRHQRGSRSAQMWMGCTTTEAPCTGRRRTGTSNARTVKSTAGATRGTTQTWTPDEGIQPAAARIASATSAGGRLPSMIVAPRRR